MGVGDTVLVLPSFNENLAISLSDLSEGDNVTLYTLKDETRIAIPRLEFNIDSHVFITPSFDFAGFNWKLDFDFDLIPFAFQLVFSEFKHYKMYVRNTGRWLSGISPEGNPGCYVKFNQGWGAGGADADYAFLFEDGGGPIQDDYIDVKVTGPNSIMVWAGPYNPSHSYFNELWYKNTKLTEGTGATMPHVVWTLSR